MFGLNVLAWLAVFDLENNSFLEVNFFDVGQGDAIFIETARGHQILIDGGPSSAILEKLAKEIPFWDRTIDLIILTHPERDHLSGLIEVLKRYKVENILWTGIVRDTPEYKEWESLLKKERAEIFIAKINQRINCSTPEVKHCQIDILHPFENLEGQEFKESNNTSIIAKLVFGENSFLFTGDAHKSLEKKLVEREAAIESDVLKISHHGSKGSTAEEFVKEVSPQIAVISAGKDNSYGHPRQEVLDILTKYGIKVLRTDNDGDIKIISDGENIKIKNQNVK
ncbi:MBL fold metallo-hydrolase [Patescibacteria group bacterium]|nr:MBL fold metallo-hydrolase [Patescibacteria group bacterium]MBU4481671.1 MBL fold metallo-hydrolase [Patescibacteria group bacterium]